MSLGSTARISTQPMVAPTTPHRVTRLLTAFERIVVMRPVHAPTQATGSRTSGLRVPLCHALHLPIRESDDNVGTMKDPERSWRTWMYDVGKNVASIVVSALILTAGAKVAGLHALRALHWSDIASGVAVSIAAGTAAFAAAYAYANLLFDFVDWIVKHRTKQPRS
jgi:hypothetical protein